jgi:hypothetical protein
VKVAGALEPPPPPPEHGVTQPGCGGEGGLKTVTFAVKFVVPEFTSTRPAVTDACIWQEELLEQVRLVRASFVCVPRMLQFIWDPPDGSVVGRKLEPFSVKVNVALQADPVQAGAFKGLMLVRPGNGFGSGLI